MKRWEELFLDENGYASMSRFLLFLSFFVASWIVVVDTYRNGASEGIFGIYIGAYALSYVGGQFANKKHAGPQVVVQTGVPAKAENNGDAA